MIVAAVLGIIVATHTAATFLWISPQNPFNRAVAEPLESAMDPVFQQNWSLFAPTPINVENSLHVRALDAELNATDWVDVTDLEISANFTHHVLPNRGSRPTRMLAARAYAQFNKLSDGELKVLGNHYHEDAWPRLAEALDDADGSSSAARRSLVLSYDRTMAAYATEFARATVTEIEPKYVQFRVVRQRAASFAQRGGTPQEPTTYSFGRRPMYEFPRQDSDAFRDAIERFHG
ncbi:DUF5819 family protein [Isoptericola croceus]|uniref:DUF5819 family protein n=1 Tax=Isoptericola croceus TaxID=3031406 RepID=UPI0023F655AC|nr:DUF5819 family protein [Isoptericola croceus]